jgi:hypothetical protein
VDAWLTTAKCATKVGVRLGGAPVWDPGLVEYSASPAPLPRAGGDDGLARRPAL